MKLRIYSVSILAFLVHLYPFGIAWMLRKNFPVEFLSSMKVEIGLSLFSGFLISMYYFLSEKKYRYLFLSAVLVIDLWNTINGIRIYAAFCIITDIWAFATLNLIRKKMKI